MSSDNRPLRLAMWSGPRNISTAMMRSWGNRADTVVMDEPFYAFYLQQTGKAHPGVMEIITHGTTDVHKILNDLAAPLPAGKRILFQKQMSHHLLPEIDRRWLAGVTNVFLIRDPADVINSYIRKNQDPAVEDLGFAQQMEIFDWVVEHTGTMPPVIDARDVLRDPEAILTKLCQAVGVAFDPAMLSWPAGLRTTDGVWAKYWYDEVIRSTSFRPYQEIETSVPARLQSVQENCREMYERLWLHRLR